MTQGRPGRVFYPILTFLCLAHYFAWLWICYPGVLYGDNAMMLAESFTPGGIGDQHSVMYIWLLTRCHQLFGIGIGYPLIWGLFFWHLGIFWYCVGLYRMFRNYWVLMFLVFFADLPFITFVLPHIQLKDFNMSAVFFAATGLLFLIWTNPGKVGKIMTAGLVALFFLAITLRHNAIFAFLPIAFLMAVIAGRKAVRSHGLKYAIQISGVAIALTLVLLLGKTTFEKMAGDYENYFIHGCIFSFDLAGMSLQLDSMEIPNDRLMAGVGLADLRKVFNPAGWDPLWGGWNSTPRILKGGENKPEYEELRGRWIRMVAHHPGAYLAHRRAHFNAFLEGISRNPYLCICEWTPEASWSAVRGFTPEALRAQTADRLTPEDFKLRGKGFLLGLERTNIYLQKKLGDWPYLMYPIYTLNSLNIGLILCIVFCYLIWRWPLFFDDYQKKLIPFALIIFLSGWVYFVGYFFVSVSSDWRYTHWSGLAFWIGLITLGIAIAGTRCYPLLYQTWKTRKNQEIK